MTSMRIIAAAVAIVSALAGCSGAAAPAAIVPAPNVLPHAVPIGVSRTIPDTEVTLDPPGVTDLSSAAVSSSTAFALCGSGVADCGAGVPARVELARVTDPSWGGTSSTSGALRQVLVWVFTWTGLQTCPVVQGPLGARSASPAPTAGGACQQLTFVDATTGAFIYSLRH